MSKVGDSIKQMTLEKMYEKQFQIQEPQIVSDSSNLDKVLEYLQKEYDGTDPVLDAKKIMIEKIEKASNSKKEIHLLRKAEA